MISSKGVDILLFASNTKLVLGSAGIERERKTLTNLHSGSSFSGGSAVRVKLW